MEGIKGSLLRASFSFLSSRHELLFRTLKRKKKQRREKEKDTREESNVVIGFSFLISVKIECRFVGFPGHDPSGTFGRTTSVTGLYLCHLLCLCMSWEAELQKQTVRF